MIASSLFRSDVTVSLSSPPSASALSSAASLCAKPTPRVVSHRGVDEDAHGGPAPSTARSIKSLLDEGFGSFDVDLFWAAEDIGGRNLFIGHPPSLRKLWALPDEVHALPIKILHAKAKAAAPTIDKATPMLTLAELCHILANRRADELGTVSLELKFPQHAEWRRNVDVLYTTLAAAGAGRSQRALFVIVVTDAAQATEHRLAQARHGLAMPLYLVVGDLGARIGADGEPHANLTMLAAEPAARIDGWSCSVKLFDAELRAAATRAHKPLAAWTIDTEAALRRAYASGADDVVTNKPRWARRVIAQWRAECGG